MDTLGTIRVKLISHKSSLTLFLDTIQLHQSGKMATTLDNHGGQLDVILDKVDLIAARMGQKSGSIMTTYDDDDKEVWKQFRRELVAEGFSSDVLTQHKVRSFEEYACDHILTWIFFRMFSERISAKSINKDCWMKCHRNL
jgi:hypothetical protein